MFHQERGGRQPWVSHSNNPWPNIDREQRGNILIIDLPLQLWRYCLTAPDSENWSDPAHSQTDCFLLDSWEIWYFDKIKSWGVQCYCDWFLLKMVISSNYCLSCDLCPVPVLQVWWSLLTGPVCLVKMRSADSLSIFHNALAASQY